MWQKRKRAESTGRETVLPCFFFSPFSAFLTALFFLAFFRAEPPRPLASFRFFLRSPLQKGSFRLYIRRYERIFCFCACPALSALIPLCTAQVMRKATCLTTPFIRCLVSLSKVGRALSFGFFLSNCNLHTFDRVVCQRARTPRATCFIRLVHVFDENMRTTSASCTFLLFCGFLFRHPFFVVFF